MKLREQMKMTLTYVTYGAVALKYWQAFSL